MESDNMTFELIQGERYKIVKKGAKLQRWVSNGNSSYNLETRELILEEIIEYRGKSYGIGHDDVYYDIFKSFRGEEFIGSFYPDVWGSANLEFLKPIRTPTKSESSAPINFYTISFGEVPGQEFSPDTLEWNTGRIQVIASSNSSARSLFKKYMKNRYPGYNYQINHIYLDDYNSNYAIIES